MRGPEGLVSFLTGTTPGGSKKLGVIKKMRNILALSWPQDPHQLQDYKGLTLIFIYDGLRSKGTIKAVYGIFCVMSC